MRDSTQSERQHFRYGAQQRHSEEGREQNSSSKDAVLVVTFGTLSPP